MKLFYKKYGKHHQSIIILHGLYGCADNWMNIGELLSDTYTIYTVDLRNHGHSPHHPDNSYTILCKDVMKLSHELQLDRFILLGHSMGGKTAMLFASLFPEKLNGLIIVDIAPKNYLIDIYSLHYKIHKKIIEIIKTVDISTIYTRSEIEQKFLQYIEEKRIVKFLGKNIVRQKDTQLFAWQFNKDAIINNMNSILSDVNYQTFKESISGFPVLFIRGELSDYIQLEDIKKISYIFPVAEFVTIRNAGHWVHVEQPIEFIKTVKQFLSKFIPM